MPKQEVLWSPAHAEWIRIQSTVFTTCFDEVMPCVKKIRWPYRLWNLQKAFHAEKHWIYCHWEQEYKSEKAQRIKAYKFRKRFVGKQRIQNWLKLPSIFDVRFFLLPIAPQKIIEI